MKPVKQSGFTLVELMVTVVVIGILAAIAMPAYQEYVKRGHRAAAQAEMMDIANRQQQYFLANRGYASSVGTLNYSLPDAVSARYTAAIAADNTATPPTFTITFTATGTQVSDGDLTLNSQGAKTPAAKW